MKGEKLQTRKCHWTKEETVSETGLIMQMPAATASIDDLDLTHMSTNFLPTDESYFRTFFDEWVRIQKTECRTIFHPCHSYDVLLTNYLHHFIAYHSHVEIIIGFYKFSLYHETIL